MKRIKNYSEEDLITIRNGGLIAFPTETVYGFGVIFDDKKGYINKSLNEDEYNEFLQINKDLIDIFP